MISNSDMVFALYCLFRFYLILREIGFFYYTTFISYYREVEKIKTGKRLSND